MFNSGEVPKRYEHGATCDRMHRYGSQEEIVRNAIAGYLNSEDVMVFHLKKPWKKRSTARFIANQLANKIGIRFTVNTEVVKDANGIEDCLVTITNTYILAFRTHDPALGKWSCKMDPRKTRIKTEEAEKRLQEILSRRFKR